MGVIGSGALVSTEEAGKDIVGKEDAAPGETHYAFFVGEQPARTVR